MNNIKELHPKEGVTLLAIKVPEGISGFVLFKSVRHSLFTKGGSHVSFLPEGNWQLLGTPEQITEEIWRSLLHEPKKKYIPGGYGIYFYNYKRDIFNEDTAIESGISFLEANEVYSVNPLGTHPSTWKYVTEAMHMISKDIERWAKFEANTGTWVILLKP